MSTAPISESRKQRYRRLDEERFARWQALDAPDMPKMQPARAGVFALLMLGSLILFLIALPLAAIGFLADIEVLKNYSMWTIGLFLIGFPIVYLFFLRIRHKQLPVVARQLGLEFSRTDTTGLDAEDLPFVPFQPSRFGVALPKPLRVGFTNVMSGSHAGRPIRVFDAHVTIPANNGPSTNTFVAGLAEIDAECPHVRIGRYPDSKTEREVKLEWGQFNREYRVLSADARFATTLVDALMMQWLIDNLVYGYKFEVSGHQVLCYGPEGSAESNVEIYYALRGFIDRVPKVLSSLYPREKV